MVDVARGMLVLGIDQARLRADMAAAASGLGTLPAVKKAGEDSGSNYGQGFRASATKALTATMTALMKATGQYKATIPVGADPRTANLTIDALKARLAAEAKRVTTFKVDANDKAAQVTLARVNADLAKLSAAVAKPGIDVQGKQRALADILTVSIALDKLSAKRATPSVDVKGTGVAAGTLGGIGPAIPGVGLKAAGIIGFGAPLIGALPAMTTAVAAGGVGALGAGALAGGFGAVQTQVSPLMTAQTQAKTALAAATTPAQATAAQAKLDQVNTQIAQLNPALQSIIKSETQIEAAWKKFATSLAPLFAGPVAQVASLFTSLTPVLHQFFASAATLAGPLIAGIGNLARQVLPLLSQAFRAVAPLMKPMIDGLTGLITGIMPGLITLLKAAKPAVDAFAGILGQLGKDLGGMFTAFAPALQASGVIFKSITDILGALFPIIGQLASIFAQALAPVFSAFAGTVKALLPFLTLVGQILASLAKAVLGDLVAAFKALAGLLTAIAPALTSFATMLGDVFTVMENSGVFAILGNAIMALVPPLATMINALLTGLKPILPVVVDFVGQLAGMLAGALAAGIAKILPPLTTLATTVLAAIAKILPVVLPLLLSLAGIFTQVVVTAIAGVASALAAIIKAIPAGVLQGIVLGILAIVGAMKAWAVIQGVMDALMSANPLGLIVLGIAAVVIAVTELVTHWNAVWGAIKAAASAVAGFLSGLFRNQVVQDILAVWSLGLVPLAEHWSQVWGAIKATVKAAWTWIVSNVMDPIKTFFTQTIPSWFAAFIGFVTTKLVTPWKNLLKGGWDWIVSNVLTPVKTFFTQTIPSWFDAYMGFVNSRLVTPWKNAIKGGWDWIVSNVWNPLKTMVTSTIPGWWDSAVGAIGRAWDKVKQIVHDPAAFVVNTILGNLVKGFDTVISWVGLKGPAVPHMASKGWKVPGYGGGDKHLALLEGGESVVPKELTPQIAGWLKAHGVPGHQFGWIGDAWNGVKGAAGDIGNFASSLWSKVTDVAGMTAALATGNTAALIADFTKLTGQKIPGSAGAYLSSLAKFPPKVIGEVVDWLVKHIGPEAGGAIAQYAASFIGKIPYVWGGTSLNSFGADCSGFTQSVYSHFGIGAPRTSEAQGAWVKKGPPVSGGLAFYHSPGGGADPGHVAIVNDMNSVISQGGGMGPIRMGIRGMPLLWTGSPPGGFGSAGAGGGAAGPGAMSPSTIAALWTSLGGPASAAANMARIAMAESGDVPNIVQKGQPPGLTGYGLFQITPTSGITQNGAYGNLLNASNNIRAAIALYRSSGYQPWASDPVGASLVRSGLSYGEGGPIREPVLGVGRSGALYRFGERGETEWVTPESKMAGPQGGADVVAELKRISAHLARLNQISDAAPARTGAHVGAAVNSAGGDAAFRARYPSGGI